MMKKKVIILGAGFSGLSAAYTLLTNPHCEVFILEKEALPGGLALGKKLPGHDWALEYFYHHIFSGDRDIVNLATHTGYQGFTFYTTNTSSLYHTQHGFEYIRLDSPLDLLRIPLLSLLDKVRAACTLGFLKLSPFISFFERITAATFLTQVMGKRSWVVLWEQLFRKKFGKYAENILLSFFWARIKARSKQLGYPQGGFIHFALHLTSYLDSQGVTIKKKATVQEVREKDGKYTVITSQGTFIADSIISTLPTLLHTRVMEKVLTEDEYTSLNNIEHLAAINLIIESPTPLMNSTYWLNICVEDVPCMVIVQHTNLIAKKHYNNNHIAYIGWYTEQGSALWQMSEEEVWNYILPHINRIFPDWDHAQATVRLTKAPHAQPLYNKTYLKNKPTIISQTPGIFLANLDTTYPYDRGTNFAVRGGKMAAEAALDYLFPAQ